MASTDAKPYPAKNAAFRVHFPIFDADGDLVTGATGLDSEISKDGGTFADCTNEATEIATASGIYYLDLTSTEMNADCVCIIVKTTSSGAKTTPIFLYPQEAGDANAFGDDLLKRDMSAISGESARSPLNALRVLRNKVSVSAGTMTVTKEDDSTSAWTAAVTSTSGADPITAIDPA
jgi:hypothetical protein